MRTVAQCDAWRKAQFDSVTNCQQTYEAQPVERVQHQDGAQRAVEHEGHGLGERKAANVGANRNPLRSRAKGNGR